VLIIKPYHVVQASVLIGQINWDDCSSNPCLNDAECLDGIDSFNCSCLPNFAGTFLS
jgi:hypothetical protein